MRMRGAAGRENRRGGKAVRDTGSGRDAERNRGDRTLSARTCALQGAQRGSFPRSTAEVERRQDPAQGFARNSLNTASSMTIPNYSMMTIPQFVGRELGVSDWVTVTQDRIDQFAACTGDRQWIHVAVDRDRG